MSDEARRFAVISDCGLNGFVLHYLGPTCPAFADVRAWAREAASGMGGYSATHLYTADETETRPMAVGYLTPGDKWWQYNPPPTSPD